MRPATLVALSLGLIGLVACSSSAPPADQMAPPIQPVVTPPPQVEHPTPPPAPPPAPLKFAAHVASYRNMADAEADWPRLSARFPVIRDAAHQYVEVDLGGQRGKVVRLLLGGFAERNQAVDYCHGLRATGLYCAPHDRPTGPAAVSGKS